MMAEFGLTPAGYNRKRLADIKTDLETAMKAVRGENIDLSPESGYGQFIGIMAEALADQSESQENVYNSQYPSTADGAALSNVVTYNGVNRQDATSSTVNLTLSGAEGTDIPAGSLVAVASTGEVFSTDEDITIPVDGNIFVGATAIDTGAISAAIGTITSIETPIFGWTAVTNTVAATAGRDEETDAELRIRRISSTITLGQNLVDSLFGQLLNIEGVEDAVVISNGTDSVDANGIPAHQFLSVISGGDVANIADAIWKNNPQGILSFGATTEQIFDAQGFPQDIKFSRPSDINIYFKLDITTNANEFPGTGSDDIKDAIAAYGLENFRISDDVILSEFYTAINETPGILTMDLRIGLSASPTGTANLTIAADEISRYDITRVEVNIA